MNILIVTPHFHPENFRINDFAVEFQKKGHYISVLIAEPDYPDGKFLEDMAFLKEVEKCIIT